MHERKCMNNELSSAKPRGMTHPSYVVVTHFEWFWVSVWHYVIINELNDNLKDELNHRCGIHVDLYRTVIHGRERLERFLLRFRSCIFVHAFSFMHFVPRSRVPAARRCLSRRPPAWAWSAGLNTVVNFLLKLQKPGAMFRAFSVEIAKTRGNFHIVSLKSRALESHRMPGCTRTRWARTRPSTWNARRNLSEYRPCMVAATSRCSTEKCMNENAWTTMPICIRSYESSTPVGSSAAMAPPVPQAKKCMRRFSINNAKNAWGCFALTLQNNRGNFHTVPHWRYIHILCVIFMYKSARMSSTKRNETVPPPDSFSSPSENAWGGFPLKWTRNRGYLQICRLQLRSCIFSFRRKNAWTKKRFPKNTVDPSARWRVVPAPGNKSLYF
jgi:hypothetical protein